MDRAAVQNRAVTDGDMAANQGRELVAGNVDDGVILNIGVVTDANVKDIAAQDAVEPDARMVADLYVTDNMRAILDKCSFSYLRANAFVCPDHKILSISQEVRKESALQRAALELSTGESDLYILTPLVWKDKKVAHAASRSQVDTL